MRPRPAHCTRGPTLQAWGSARTSTCCRRSPRMWWPPATPSTACCCSTRKTASSGSSSSRVRLLLGEAGAAPAAAHAPCGCMRGAVCEPPRRRPARAALDLCPAPPLARRHAPPAPGHGRAGQGAGTAGGAAGGQGAGNWGPHQQGACGLWWLHTAQAACMPSARRRVQGGLPAACMHPCTRHPRARPLPRCLQAKAQGEAHKAELKAAKKEAEELGKKVGAARVQALPWQRTPPSRAGGGGGTAGRPARSGPVRGPSKHPTALRAGDGVRAAHRAAATRDEAQREGV